MIILTDNNDKPVGINANNIASIHYVTKDLTEIRTVGLVNYQLFITAKISFEELHHLIQSDLRAFKDGYQ